MKTGLYATARTRGVSARAGCPESAVDFATVGAAVGTPTKFR